MSCLSLQNRLQQVIRPRMERGCPRCWGALCCLLRAWKERLWPWRAAATGVSQNANSLGRALYLLSNSTQGWNVPEDRMWLECACTAALMEALPPGSSTSLAGSPLFLPFSDEVFEELIHRPCNGCGGDLVNDSSLHPSEVGGHPTYLIHRPEGTGHACDVSYNI